MLRDVRPLRYAHPAGPNLDTMMQHAHMMSFVLLGWLLGRLGEVRQSGHALIGMVKSNYKMPA
jgi:hypothetical protein